MIKILQGNCIDKIKEIDDNSIDCVVSSPPYFGLRDYGVDGQFGLEKTYHDYLANTVKVFETFKAKLKDTATIWWNVGDSYNSTNGFCRNKGKYKRKGRDGGSNDKKLIKNSIIKEIISKKIEFLSCIDNKYSIFNFSRKKLRTLL